MMGRLLAISALAAANFQQGGTVNQSLKKLIELGPGIRWETRNVLRG